MSRLDLGGTVRRILTTAKVEPRDKRDLNLILKLLEGGWTPAAPRNRKDGYKCLVYTIYHEGWQEGVWDPEISAWWTDRGFVNETEIKAFGPLPMLPEVQHAS